MSPKKRRRPKPKSLNNYIVSSNPKHAERKIDLHGYRSFEIKPILEEFIDQAHNSRLLTIVIIHGKGEGILKTETINILNKNKKILRHEPSIGEEGGFGATTAELKYSNQKIFYRNKNNSITPTSINKSKNESF